MKMNQKFIATLGAIVASTVLGHSQVPLQPGDVYTYTFTNLPQLVPGPVTETPVGGFTVHVSSFDAASDQLFVEMFENSTNEAPLVSFVQETAMDGASSMSAW